MAPKLFQRTTYSPLNYESIQSAVTMEDGGYPDYSSSVNSSTPRPRVPSPTLPTSLELPTVTSRTVPSLTEIHSKER